MKVSTVARTMLKGIPAVLSPQLLSILARMGHGDELVIADANFPSASVSHAGKSELVYASGVFPDLFNHRGIGAVPMLNAILTLLPLDKYVPTPVCALEKRNRAF